MNKLFFYLIQYIKYFKKMKILLIYKYFESKIYLKLNNSKYYIIFNFKIREILKLSSFIILLRMN